MLSLLSGKFCRWQSFTIKFNNNYKGMFRISIDTRQVLFCPGEFWIRVLLRFGAAGTAGLIRGILIEGGFGSE